MKHKSAIMLPLMFILCLLPAVIYAESEEHHVDAMMNAILEKYKGDVTREQLEAAAIQGMFSILDEHSKYYEDPKDINTLVNQKEYVGVGLKITRIDSKVVIERVLEGHSADKAGLLAGDQLIAADGQSLKDQSLDDIAALMAGSANTELILTINRQGQELDIALIREPIKTDHGSIGRVEPVGDHIKYMEIKNFNLGVYDAFHSIIGQSRLDGTQGLIIDLRNNKGGLLSEVVKMCQDLVPQGPIVFVVDKDGNEEQYASYLNAKTFDIVVLVNKESASASEIFASSIQESEAGIVIGEQTYGKGTVQQVFKDQRGHYYKITTAEYLTRTKRKINGIGLKPNIEVHSPPFLSKLERKFELGDQHADIEQIKDILKFLGYDISGINDVYDDELRQAVAAFQREHGLFVYGVCDLATQQALNDQLQEQLKHIDIELGKAIAYFQDKQQ